MKYTSGSIFLLLLVCALSVAVSGVIRSTPTAVATSEGFVVVRWQTDDETGVQKFEIWRAQVLSGGTVGEFTKLDPPSQPNLKPSSYEFVDGTVFKTTANLFIYKVRVVFQNGSFSDSDVVRVSAMTSAARRTWGSIKAMFR